jgi:hypothetical protein
MRPAEACPVCRRMNCTEHVLPAWTGRRPSRSAERSLCRKVVAEWIATYGYVCPGYGRTSHYATDLSADHIEPVGNGGDPMGPMTVLCKSCNSRRGQAMQLRRG